jgi:hypothetical protein
VAGGRSGRAVKATATTRHPRLRVGSREIRVHREARAEDDGYRSALLPGLRSSEDARLLAEEIAFASGRLLALEATPPGLYAEVRALAEEDLEQATWMCFLIAYLSPLDGEDPFVGIRLALAADGSVQHAANGVSPDGGAWGWYAAGDLVALDEVPLGPRTSHDPTRGTETLLAYRHWAEQAGAQASAFVGDPGWSPQRRFERLFERLALPGFARMGRYDLLVTLGRLGLYELRPDALNLSGARGASAGDLATLAAKRAFAIGDPLLLERRALELAEATSVPIETLDLALANWGVGERATLGFRTETCDRHALERVLEALKL